MTKTTGTVKFFDHKKGFGFVQTEDLGDAFIHASVTGDQSDFLNEGVHISITVVQGERGLVVTEFHSIMTKASKPKKVTVLGILQWFNTGKGFGFIQFDAVAGLSKPTAFLHLSSAKKSGATPRDLHEGMPLLATVHESPKGPSVDSFEWGEAVQVQWEAKLAALPAEAAPELEVVAQSAKRPNGKKARKAKAGGNVRLVKGGIPSAASYGVKPVDVAELVTAAAARPNGSGEVVAAALRAAVASDQTVH